MGIRSNASGSAFGYIERKVQDKYDETMDDVEATVEEIMADAATEMKKYISERGVHNTVPNGNGRGSGAMENAADSRVTRRRDVVHGEFGWLPGRPRPKHYGFQESGTLGHGEPSGDPSPVPGTNRGIRPMMALYDAEQHAREQMRNRFQGRR